MSLGGGDFYTKAGIGSTAHRRKPVRWRGLEPTSHRFQAIEMTHLIGWQLTARRWC
jgi:hypothetical protein